MPRTVSRADRLAGSCIFALIMGKSYSTLASRSLPTLKKKQIGHQSP
jgi:hypothetical protein